MTSPSYSYNNSNINFNIIQGPYPVYSKNVSNANFNQQAIYDKSSYPFDLKSEKAFISKEKQWLNSIKNPESKIVQSVIGNTVTKPNSSSLADQKRNSINSKFEFEQNLAKTVKHSVLPYKKIQPQINPQHFKASSIYGQPQKNFQQTQNIESKTSKLVSSSNQTSQNHSIMSIDQIREVQKKEFSEKTIHKITSSTSRNKLKSSSSKDSKGSSVNLQNKSAKFNAQTERYNKYINSELININIDLKKQVPNSIIAPNLNARRFGGSEPLYSPYEPYKMENYLSKSKPVHEVSRVISTGQRNFSPFEDNHLPIQTKPQPNDELAFRESIPREDKDLPLRIKTRSKSNLSRYSQLKDQQNNINTQCLVHCEEKTAPLNPKNIEIVMHQTLEKSIKNQSIPQQKSEKKIHFVSCSSVDKNHHKFYKSNNNQSKNYQSESVNHTTQSWKKREQIQKIPISFSETKVNLQNRRQRPQTQRKSITNFNLHPQILKQDEIGCLNHLIQEKMKKRPIRMTIQKKN